MSNNNNGWMHEDVKNFETFQSSLRHFPALVQKVSGGTDIDCVVEHEGHFIFFEGKNIHPGSDNETNNKITVKYGQYRMLDELARALGNRAQVFLVGCDPSNGHPVKIANMLSLPSKSAFVSKDSSGRWNVSMPQNYFHPTDLDKVIDFTAAWWKNTSGCRFEQYYGLEKL